MISESPGVRPPKFLVSVHNRPVPDRPPQPRWPGVAAVHRRPRNSGPHRLSGRPTLSTLNHARTASSDEFTRVLNVPRCAPRAALAIARTVEQTLTVAARSPEVTADSVIDVLRGLAPDVSQSYHGREGWAGVAIGRNGALPGPVSGPTVSETKFGAVSASTVACRFGRPALQFLPARPSGTRPASAAAGSSSSRPGPGAR
jgi:hypothetical protein